MAVSVFLFAAPALYLRKPRRALLCGATSALALLATLQSLERAPFVGLLAGLLLVAVFVVFKKNCRPRSAARAFALLAALLCVTLTQALPLPREQQPGAPAPLTTIARLQGKTGEEANTHVRFLFWGVALEMLRARPLLGVGANNYAVHFAEARALFAERHPDSALLGLNENFLAVYAHNEYVQMAAELGAPAAQQRFEGVSKLFVRHQSFPPAFAPMSPCSSAIARARGTSVAGSCFKKVSSAGIKRTAWSIAAFMPAR